MLGEPACLGAAVAGVERDRLVRIVPASWSPSGVQTGREGEECAFASMVDGEGAQRSGRVDGG